MTAEAAVLCDADTEFLVSAPLLACLWVWSRRFWPPPQHSHLQTPPNLTSIAGQYRSSGYTGDGAQATAAQLNDPSGVAVDGSGNVYIADNLNNVVRKVTASTGVISAFAGTGTAGFSGDGGQATAAQLNTPQGVAVDGSGNVYITDAFNNVVRKVTASNGVISTFAGTGTAGFSGDGGQAAAAQLSGPVGVAVDRSGNVYISDSGNSRVRTVAATGVISTVAGNGTAGFSGDGGQATAAQLSGPYGVAVDGSGNVYIADYGNHLVRKINASNGVISTVAGNGTYGYAGDGYPATIAEFREPAGVAVDGGGDLYITDSTNNAVREVSAATGIISNFGGYDYYQYTYSPVGVAVDGSGVVYIADSNNQRITKTSPLAGVTPQGSPRGKDALGGGQGAQTACPCAVANPVDLASGDYYDTRTDLTIPGAGIPLTFTRTFDAEAAQAEATAAVPAAALGYGWSDNLSMTLAYAGGVATVTQANGSQIALQFYPQGTTEPAWCAPDTAGPVFCPTAPRFIATLKQGPGGTWAFTNSMRSPLTYTFSAAGAMTQIANQQGDTLISSAYAPGAGQANCPTGDTCTAWASTPSGETAPANTLVEAFNTTLQLVSVFDAASAAASTQVATFTYTGAGCSTWATGPKDLCSATSPGGLNTTFTYDTSKPSPYQYDQTTMKLPSSGLTTNTFDASGRVTKQIMATGSTSQELDFAYSADPNVRGGTDTQVTTYPNGTGGAATTAVYVFSNGILVNSIDPLTASTLQTPDPTTLLSQATQDANGNITTTQLANFASPGGTPISSGNATLVTDAMGNTTQHAYTAANLAWCTVDPADYANGARCPATAPTAPPTGAPGYTATVYDANNHVTSVSDPLGDTSTISYTTGGSVPAGLAYCTVDPANYKKGVVCPPYGAAHVTGTISRTFDAAGDALSVTDADGNTTTWVYAAPDHPGMATSVTDPDGTTTAYTYNAAGEITKSVATFGAYAATTLAAYDTAGRKYCQVDAYETSQAKVCPATAPTSPPTGTPGYTATIYNSGGQVTSVTNPVGGTAQYAYDGLGHKYCSVAAFAYAAGTRCPTVLPLTIPTPTSDAYLAASIDTFDAAGQPTQHTNPLGGITLTVYDPVGNITQSTIESNDSTKAPAVTTSSLFDADNRATSTTNASGTASRHYDPNSHIFCTVSANAAAQGSTAYQCPSWQPSWITAPPSPASEYSATPNPTQANNVTLTFADAAGRQVQSTNPKVETTLAAFDAAGRNYCSITPANTALGATCPTAPPTAAPAAGSNPKYATTIYDPAGRTASDTNPVGDTTRYLYDPAGNKTQSTDSGGNATIYCYYWQTSTCAAAAPPGGGAAAMLYATTTPTTVADPTGKTTTNTYWPGGAPHVTTSPAGTTTITPDAAGDPASVTYLKSGSYTQPANVTYTYNPNQSRKTMLDATGTTTYAYDKLGDVTSKSLAAKTGTGLVNQTLGYTYFTTGKVQNVVYPTYGATTNPTVSYTYDPTGSMLAVSDWFANPTSFAHDADNNLTTTTPPNGTTTTIAYNQADVPTSVTLAAAANPTPPIAQFSYARNSSEQVASETDTQAVTANNTYGYDPANRVNAINAGLTVYNPAGQPTTTPTGATANYDNAGELTGDTTSAYTYNTNGARTLKTTAGSVVHYNVDQIDQLTSVATGTTTNAAYTYNGDGARIGKTVGATTFTNTWDTNTPTPAIMSDGTNDYIHGPNGTVVEQISKSTNTPTYLTQDQLGSTRILTNQAGVTTATYTYDAYGNQTTKTGTATTPIGYAGGYTDTETGLLYLVHRYYDPQTAQFMSVDPLVAQTQSAYGYVDNNPLNGTDPTGLMGLGFKIPQWIPVVGGGTCIAIGDPACNNRKANRWATDTEAGIVNGITVGHGRQVLGLVGAAGNVDYCSTAFKGGTIAGLAIDAAALAGAGGDNANPSEVGAASYGKSEVPSWVFNGGYGAEAGESPVQAATRIMNEQYGEDNWVKGADTEFNKIVKWVSRTGG